MDEINDFFNTIPWDELGEDGSKTPIGDEAAEFFHYLINKSPNKEQNQEDTAEELSPVKSPRRAKPFLTNAVPTFPRMSSLTAEDQSYYLAARYGHQPATQEQPLFQQLHPLVLAEQKEFVEWVAANRAVPLPREDLVQLGAKLLAVRQEHALSTLAKWPQVYLKKQIPLRRPSQRPVHFVPIKHVHSEGRVANCRPLECIDFSLSEEFSIEKSAVPISEDALAMRLAVEHSADVILSPGAFLALADPNRRDQDVPLIVKEIEGSAGKSHRILVFDKPLPAVSLNDFQKMTWAAKRSAKRTFFSSSQKHLSFSTMKVEVEKTDFSQELKNYAAAREGQINCNHTYSLWGLEHERAHRTADTPWGRQGCPIRILVRSQYHGFQETDQDAPLFVHLGLKLEWSSHYGAEMTTLSEATRDWVALTFRPEAKLLRARVDPKTLQVSQVEVKDLKALSSEARVRGLDVPKTYSALHTVFSELLILAHGEYLLRVEPKNAALHIYGSQTLLSSHEPLDLAKEYKTGATFTSVEGSIVAHIDPDVVTPWNWQNQRVPATFSHRRQAQRKSSRKKSC